MTKKLKSGTPFVYDENDRVVGIRDPHTGTDTDLVTAVTGPGGGNIKRGTVVTTGNGVSGLPAGRLHELLSWVKPVHLPILDPAQFVGMTPITLSKSWFGCQPLSSSHPSPVSISGATVPSARRMPETVNSPIPPPWPVTAVTRSVSVPVCGSRMPTSRSFSSYTNGVPLLSFFVMLPVSFRLCP